MSYYHIFQLGSVLWLVNLVGCFLLYGPLKFKDSFVAYAMHAHARMWACLQAKEEDDIEHHGDNYWIREEGYLL